LALTDGPGSRPCRRLPGADRKWLTRCPTGAIDPKRKFGLLGIDPTALLSVAAGA
jgi:hypothetical protein